MSAEKKDESPSWYREAKKYEGSSETDPVFNRKMTAKWPLVGLNLKTIATNWAAWCGLAVAVALAGAGLSHQRNGAAAKNWDAYGVAIDWRKAGIPRGAIVRLNHKFDCKSLKGNHVTMADGDCTAADLTKPGATFNGYGGNQGNRWRVSTYPVREICSVRWPAEKARPAPIAKSDRCTSGKAKKESTR